MRSCSAAIAAKSAVRVELRRDELEILAGDLEARLRERHLEVVDERAEERQLAVEAAQRVARPPPRTPLPQPYHAGSSVRFCVQAKTHGIARSDSR